MTSTAEDNGKIFKRDTFADYVGMGNSTLANWIQKRRKQAGLKASCLKPGAVNSNQSNGRWVEAILENNPEPKGLLANLPQSLNFTCPLTQSRHPSGAMPEPKNLD